MGSVVTLQVPPTRKGVGSHRKATERVRFTEERVASLPMPPSGATYTYDDCVPGLALRVTRNGVRTFVMVKKVDGRTQRITLGRSPGLRLSDARKAALKIQGEVASGVDPLAKRREARLRAETCSDFWPTYLAHIKRKNRAWERDAQRWNVDIAPRLGRKPLVEVTSTDCQKVIDDVGTKHPVKANRMAALLGAFFGHAVSCDRIARNPARGLSRYHESPRTRYLSADEIHSLLAGCATQPQPWCDLFRLLLWTGARKTAVMSMQWKDIDLQEGLWRIPAARAKNDKAAAVPLVRPAMEILNTRREFCAGSPWVFPAASSSGHVAHVAKAWGALITGTGLSDVRPHDLRRTIGSWLAGSGANAFVIQKALTHQSAASAKAYAHLDVEAVRTALTQVTDAMCRVEGKHKDALGAAPRPHS